MSIATTELGPRLSVSTAGTNEPQSWGKVNFESADLLVRSQTAAPSTTVLEQGELSLVSLSAVSVVLAYRHPSGDTLYVFTNDAAE